MAICIYCKLDNNCFEKAEHVIPQVFGKFVPNNFTLNTRQDKIVCDNCNQYFGDTIELQFARNSYEGYVCRTKYQNKQPKKFDRDNIQICLKDGPHKGMYIELVDSKTNNVLPQVGLKKPDRTYDYFLLSNTPSCIDESKYLLTDKGGIHIPSYSFMDEAKQWLAQRGITFGNKQEIVLDYDNSLVEVSAQIDRTIYRAVAKIAFNYFAYHNIHKKDFLLTPRFDDVRSFILNGTVPDYTIVDVNGKPILEMEKDKDQRAHGHIVIVEKNECGSLVALVSLFNEFCYKICLAPFLPYKAKLKVGFGHFFNLHTNQINEIFSGKIARINSRIITHPGILIPTYIAL